MEASTILCSSWSLARARAALTFVRALVSIWSSSVRDSISASDKLLNHIASNDFNTLLLFNNREKSMCTVSHFSLKDFGKYCTNIIGMTFIRGIF
jgi:hypothetical protein